MQENDISRRRCIGVIIAKPDREYQKGLLCGIYRAAFEQDMNVAVFAATLAGGVASAREPELDIYTLPNYDKLDGMIYVPDSFDYQHADKVIIEPLAKAVKEKGLCAVTIDCKIDGIPSVKFDDSETTRGIIEHAIKKHGCRDIAFMTGTKGNPYAESRVILFREVMAENGLEIKPDRIYYGDFWYNEGENFVKMLTHSSGGLPEMIICANGPMACSVYRALRKAGYTVPKDVMLTCHTDERDLYKFITSSSKRADAVGYASCKRLIGLMDGVDAGEEIEPVKCGFDINESVSCGCLRSDEYDFSRTDGIDINEPMSYFSEFNLMSTDLLNRSGYREMFWALDWYTTYIKGIRGIYFCLCEGWGRPCSEDELEQSDDAEDRISADPSERIGYTDRMQMYYYRVNNSDGTHESTFESSECFPVGDMFPRLFDAEGEPSSFIFRTLRFGDNNFGYIVIDNCSNMQTYDLSLEYWLKDVGNAMEYQRKLGNEKYLYSSDFMTGLINRNGFNRMMPGIIKEAHRGGFQLLFAVCDMNGLKFINDTFGHIEGDNGIRIAADALRDADFPALTVEKNFRIGGDEFVKAVIGHFTAEDVEAFRNRIYTKLEEYNRTSGKPYPVYLSIGVVVKDPDEDYTSDSLISEADKLMFTDKQRIRKVTGFDPKRSV